MNRPIVRAVVSRFLWLAALGTLVMACSVSSGTSASVSPAATPGASDSADIPADVQAQLAELPPGTVIVPCTDAHPKLPEGLNISRAPDFYQQHPGFEELLHGYCADNPNATPILSLLGRTM